DILVNTNVRNPAADHARSFLSSDAVQTDECFVGPFNPARSIGDYDGVVGTAGDERKLFQFLIFFAELVRLYFDALFQHAADPAEGACAQTEIHPHGADKQGEGKRHKPEIAPESAKNGHRKKNNV